MDKAFKARIKFSLKKNFHITAPPLVWNIFDYIKEHSIDIYIIDEKHLSVPIADFYNYCKCNSPKSKLIFVMTEENIYKYTNIHYYLKEALISYRDFEENYSKNDFFDQQINKLTI